MELLLALKNIYTVTNVVNPKTIGMYKGRSCMRCYIKVEKIARCLNTPVNLTNFPSEMLSIFLQNLSAIISFGIRSLIQFEPAIMPNPNKSYARIE